MFTYSLHETLCVLTPWHVFCFFCVCECLQFEAKQNTDRLLIMPDLIIGLSCKMYYCSLVTRNIASMISKLNTLCKLNDLIHRKRGRVIKKLINPLMITIYQTPHFFSISVWSHIWLTYLLLIKIMHYVVYYIFLFFM